MKLALTVWNQRIAPVFDCAGTALILELPEYADGGKDRGVPVDLESPDSRRVSLAGQDLEHRVKTLVDQGVDELVCGALSRDAATLLRQGGIAVHPFVAGDVQGVVQAWAWDDLEQDDFSMPGCACVRSQGRQGGPRCGRGRRRRHGA